MAGWCHVIVSRGLTGNTRRLGRLLWRRAALSGENSGLRRDGVAIALWSKTNTSSSWRRRKDWVYACFRRLHCSVMFWALVRAVVFVLGGVVIRSFKREPFFPSHQQLPLMFPLSVQLQRGVLKLAKLEKEGLACKKWRGQCD